MGGSQLGQYMRRSAQILLEVKVWIEVGIKFGIRKDLVDGNFCYGQFGMEG